jgi:hypothetical protein
LYLSEWVFIVVLLCSLFICTRNRREFPMTLQSTPI